MRGVEHHSVAGHADGRGVLHSFEEGGPLPFAIARVFTIQGCGADTERACHAVTAHQALVAVAGGVTADLDNGSVRSQVRLERPDDVLVIRPGVWVRLHGFAAGTVLLVASSQRFADVRYFATPQPGLVEPSAPRMVA